MKPLTLRAGQKDLHSHCFRHLLGHFHVSGEIANNGYANVLGGNRGVLWDCASSEWERKNALSEATVNSQQIGTTLKL